MALYSPNRSLVHPGNRRTCCALARKQTCVCYTGPDREVAPLAALQPRQTDKKPLVVFFLLIRCTKSGSTSSVREVKINSGENGKMAHRLLVRRVWTLSVKDLRCLPASSATTASSSFSTSPQSPTARVVFVSRSRSLPRSLTHTFSRAASFNVQDHDDFTERVINSELPVLIDFHAQWCGPCKILGPRLEKAVAKQKGRVAMAKVDIDDHTDLAIEYGVSAVPTVIAMRGGDVVDHFVGIKDDDELDSFVSKIIGQ
ncbi:Thioredoxin mitochondrial [Scophthalmus maximus]|uniref:Thioredoxin, mitochondrial n=1 Tax=Scophthalmus maximus TaxID=52904 RepID=A0A2U9CPG5_SCOMX|nr:Thioredoxin mitochondrial [Scophthalmus maximus]